MDKKGEIDYLSKIVKPDVSVITNINYAHAKNFNNIKQIALAKSEIINNTKIDKVFVKGSKVLFIYNSVLKKKRGKVLNDNSQIIDLIKNDLNNNDYLMVKASNATGLNKIMREIKG